MASEPTALPPSVDLPALAVRWEGLVVTIDATTLNTVVRRVFRRVEEVEEILIEPDNGRLGLAVKVRKGGIGFTFRSHLSSMRVKDGLLGFHVDDARAFGFVSVPRWVFQRIAEKGLPGRAVFFPEDRVFVINLNTVLPPELSVEIHEVVCENGEMKLLFGPSQYRLDRLIEELGKDPFAED